MITFSGLYWINIYCSKFCVSEFYVPVMSHPLRYSANVLKTCEASRDNIGGARYFSISSKNGIVIHHNIFMVCADYFPTKKGKVKIFSDIQSTKMLQLLK